MLLQAGHAPRGPDIQQVGLATQRLGTHQNVTGPLGVGTRTGVGAGLAGRRVAVIRRQSTPPDGGGCVCQTWQGVLGGGLAEQRCWNLKMTKAKLL